MLGIGTGIMNAAGAGAGGGGGGGGFDPVADLPGTRGRLIVDLWDSTALIYSNGAGPNTGGPPAVNDVGFIPSKDGFSTWDTWENLVAGVTEECSDPTLDTPGNWTTTSATISGGAATFTGVTPASIVDDTVIASLTATREWYLVTVTFSSYTSGRMDVIVSDTSAINVTPAVGENYFWVYADNGGGQKLIIQSDTASNVLTGVISDVSCKRVPGNHLYCSSASNRLFKNTDGNGIPYLSGVSDGMLTANNITVPTWLGMMVMGQGNDVAQSSYDSLFSVDGTDNLAFGNNPTRSGAWNFEITLNAPGVTNIWKSGEDNGGDLAIWEADIDWASGLSYEIYKNDSSVATGTAPSAINLTGATNIYRMMTSGNGVDELTGNIYGLYMWESDGTQPAGLFDWLNTNTGEVF